MWKTSHTCMRACIGVATHAVTGAVMHAAISTAMNAVGNTATHGISSSVAYAANSIAMHGISSATTCVATHATDSTTMHVVSSASTHAASRTATHATNGTVLHAMDVPANYAAGSTAMHACVFQSYRWRVLRDKAACTACATAASVPTWPPRHGCPMQAVLQATVYACALPVCKRHMLSIMATLNTVAASIAVATSSIGGHQGCAATAFGASFAAVRSQPPQGLAVCAIMCCLMCGCM
eukprot:366494-Chlamydomonas_euryale.AAC.4